MNTYVEHTNLMDSPDLPPIPQLTEIVQQAVVTVTEGQTAAILAGFSALLEVQKEILQAILGIQIGDDVIGSAISRYQQKMAVVNGGMV